MSDTHIALDGPLNGTYINQEQAAANGYVLVDWTSSELAYLHLSSQPKEEQ